MISKRKYIDNFSHGKQKNVFCAILCAFLAFQALAQRLQDSYVDYIDRYREVALQHQIAFGIPASITLAQGLLESRAGQSHLATAGNNHFGIKSYNWQGEELCFGDSTRRVCYRKYGSPEDSFLDHSRFLKGKRYERLFLLDVTDYRGWAQGLSQCGYAEDPLYPEKLITLIELYQLQLLDSDPTLLAQAKKAQEELEKKQREKEERERKKLEKKQHKNHSDNKEVPPPKPKNEKKTQHDNRNNIPAARPRHTTAHNDVPPAPSRAEINAQTAKKAQRRSANQTNASADND